MASLYSYLSTLTYWGSSTSVPWTKGAATEQTITSANGSPYVTVFENDWNVWRPLYSNVDLESLLVDVNINQAPTTLGHIPNWNEAMDLWHNIRDAVEPGNVDEWEYGQPLIEFHRITAMKPELDVRSGGLFGYVRFRAIVPTGSGS